MSKLDENEEAIQVLLMTKEDKLSDWEVQFLEDIGNKETLTAKQQNKLDQIWERVMNP